MATLMTWTDLALSTHRSSNMTTMFLETITGGTWSRYFESIDWKQVCQIGFGEYDPAKEFSDELAREFFATFSHCCNNRRLFITEDEHIGLGPSSCRNGDLVCVLLGSAVPSILRPTTTSHNPSQRQLRIEHTEHAQCFGYVGQAYVHDLMRYDHEELERDIKSGVVILEDFHVCDAGEQYSTHAFNPYA